VVEQMDKDHGGDGHGDKVLGFKKKKEKNKKTQGKGISGRRFLV
jgi:hypothetical protein